MEYILFGLTFGISFLVYCMAVISTDYDRSVDDKEQEKFLIKKEEA